MNYEPRQYKAILAWGQRLGSYTFYIHDQQRQAAEENAPLDAIYREIGVNGRWHRIGDIQSEDLRNYMIEQSLKLSNEQ